MPNPNIVPENHPATPGLLNVARSPEEIKAAVDAKKPKRGIKGFRTSEKMLPYDSTKVYLQMGTVCQASDLARRALHRVAVILDDVQVSRESQTNALLDKLDEHVARGASALQGISQKIAALEAAKEALRVELNKCAETTDEWKQFELLIQRYEHLRQAEMVPLVSKAFGDLKSAMIWYQKMLEAHRDADQEALKPLAEALQNVVTSLTKVRHQKIQAALAMEERFSKSRRAYWNEQRGKLMTRKANATHPVEHQNLPYPVNSVTPVVALDPKELIEQAARQIREKGKAKLAAKQREIAEKESESDEN